MSRVNLAKALGAVTASNAELRFQLAVERNRNASLEAELRELKRWPTTPEAREELLNHFAYWLLMGVEDRLHDNEQPEWRAVFGLLDRIAKRNAAEAARDPNWRDGSPAEEDAAVTT